jgi:hypothetical protein
MGPVIKLDADDSYGARFEQAKDRHSLVQIVNVDA